MMSVKVPPNRNQYYRVVTSESSVCYYEIIDELIKDENTVLCSRIMFTKDYHSVDLCMRVTCNFLDHYPKSTKIEVITEDDWNKAVSTHYEINKSIKELIECID